jgi:hypothetical protein
MKGDSLGGSSTGLGSLGGLGNCKPAPATVAAAKDAETQSAGEVSEALAAFKAAADRERDRFAQATSPDFWFGVYFETQEQRDEFLQFLSALDLLEVQWVNGRKLAARLGCGLRSPRLPRRAFKIDSKLAELSL